LINSGEIVGVDLNYKSPIKQNWGELSPFQSEKIKCLGDFSEKKELNKIEESTSTIMLVSIELGDKCQKPFLQEGTKEEITNFIKENGIGFSRMLMSDWTYDADSHIHDKLLNKNYNKNCDNELKK
jgi:hypothetical protein